MADAIRKCLLEHSRYPGTICHPRAVAFHADRALDVGSRSESEASVDSDKPSPVRGLSKGTEFVKSDPKVGIFLTTP